MKKLLVALAVVLGLLVLAGIAIVYLVDVNAQKPRIEAAVSDALGMEFRIVGKAGLRLLPSASIALSDIRLRNRASDLATAETLRVGVRLVPLLSRRVEITEILLDRPVIRIEKGADGKFNYETPPRPPKPPAKEGAAPGASLAVSSGAIRNGTILYRDRKGGEPTEISGIDLSLTDLSLPADPGTPVPQGISFSGTVRVKEIKDKAISVSGVDAKVTASSGVYDIRPFSMKLFGGKGEGRIRVDLPRRRVEVAEFVLLNPVIRIGKGADGMSGSEPASKKPSSKEGEGLGVSLAMAGGGVRNGTILYAERKGGETTEISGIDLSLKDLFLPAGPAMPPSRAVSFTGALRVKEIRKKNLSISGVDAKVAASRGVYDIRPFSMKLFGGKGEGGIRVDLSGGKPDVRVQYTLANFRSEESLAAVAQKKYMSGPMTVAPELSFQGTGSGEMKRTARGKVSLRGEDLTLHGMDIDGVLSTLDQAQKLNLADVGAFLLAGPLGTAATKGYSFGGVYGAAAKGGETRVTRLVSEWTLRDGVAEARDVAFATRKTRIALKGKLDIVNERFVDVTVAVLDAKGCTKLRQKISGPFSNPQVDKVSTLESAIAPILGLFEQTKQLMGRRECEPFYNGSVAHPG